MTNDDLPHSRIRHKGERAAGKFQGIDVSRPWSRKDLQDDDAHKRCSTVREFPLTRVVVAFLRARSPEEMESCGLGRLIFSSFFPDS
jgi:hypothetical protein